MSRELKGKVAWITGGGTGIGLGTAQVLGEAGMTVIISGRRREALEQARAGLAAAGVRAEVEPLDVGDSDAVAQAAAAILSRHGAVDLLVNNAGMNVRERYLHELDVEDWKQMIDVNLNGALYCAKAVLPAMRAQRDGLIINVSSWGGKNVVRAAGSAYTAAKHAVVALSEAMNIEECVNGIRICALCPAEVSTPFLEKRPVPPTEDERTSFLQPRDMGRVVRFIAELPAYACINELVISPTRNPLYLAQHPAGARG